MLKNKLSAIIISLVNFLIVLALIAFVIENPFVNILLGIYAIIFSAFVSFLNRPRHRE
ncbi:MAG TPA: hypothetical protein VJ878_00465 [Candidatus Izemoplasmatales bacterium]|nr:hypothetical protein [Candidatus Izemoplasmatales bacterium]